MKKIYFSIIMLISLLAISCANTSNKETPLAKPNAQQLAFMDMEVGAFIHYGLNVYTGQEHGDGKEPASKFNPTELDVEQWVITAKNMGAKYACLTVRHEGGFCLWPTKTTDYSIANSPYKDGKGDLAKEFADACRKHGLRVAFYFSVMYDAHNLFDPEDDVQWGKPWDELTIKKFAEMGEEGKKAFQDRQIAQLTELLTNYGEIDYIWNDHWGNHFEPEIQKAVLDAMKKVQPNCLMLGPDLWVPGNESGHVVYPMWNAVHTEDGTNYTRIKATKGVENTTNDYGLLETDALTGHPLGKFWRSRECTTNTGFSSGGWFWHPGQTEPRPFADHIELYYRTVGLGANTIINLPPNAKGLIPDNVAAAAKVFGDEIKRRFANPIAEKEVTTKGNIVELEWEEAMPINTIVLMEQIKNGQRIAKYELEAWVDNKWQPLIAANNFNTEAPYNPSPKFETIGHKKIDRVEPVTTNKIRFKATDVVTGEAELRNIQVFNCAPIDQLTKL